jgi:hypothetical protein
MFEQLTLDDDFADFLTLPHTNTSSRTRIA